VRNRQQRGDRREERRCVDDECPARTAPSDQETAERRPGDAQHQRARDLIEGVRLQEVVALDELGHDRRIRRSEQRLAGTDERNEQEQVPEAQRAGDRERPDRSDRDGLKRIRRQQHAPPLDAVGHCSAEEQEDQLWDRPRDRDERQRGRRAGKLVDLPREGDGVDPVPEQRDGHSAPEQCEIPSAKRS
jgi:hypothetical protein